MRRRDRALSASPEYYQYDLDIAEVAEAMAPRGSVVGSWLLSTSPPARWRVHRHLDDFAGQRLRLRRRPLDRSSPRSTRACRHRLITAALYERFKSPAASGTSPTRSSRRCAANSVGTTRSRRSAPADAHRAADRTDAGRCRRRGRDLRRGIGQGATVAAHGTLSFAVSGGHTPWAHVRRARPRACSLGGHHHLPSRRTRRTRGRPRPQHHRSPPRSRGAPANVVPMPVNDADLVAHGSAPMRRNSPISSTSSISVSAPTVTPRRSCRMIRCSRWATGSSHSPSRTRTTGA